MERSEDGRGSSAPGVDRARLAAVLAATVPRCQLSDTIEGRYRWARAYRDGQLVCGRVELRIGHDTDRVGLTARERRYVVARFLDRLDPSLRDELTALVRRRGAAAKRVAERLAPITLVADNAAQEPLRLVGQLQPPLTRLGDLRDVEFTIREFDIDPMR